MFIRICMNTYIYVCMYLYICIYTYVDTYAYIHACTCMLHFPAALAQPRPGDGVCRVAQRTSDPGGPPNDSSKPSTQPSLPWQLFFVGRVFGPGSHVFSVPSGSFIVHALGCWYLPQPRQPIARNYNAAWTWNPKVPSQRASSNGLLIGVLKGGPEGNINTRILQRRVSGIPLALARR